MNTINLNLPLKALDGTPVMEGLNELNLGKSLAGCLIQGQSKDPLKTYEICMKLSAGDEVQLDSSDLEAFKKLIKENPLATDLLKGQALLEILKQTS